MRRWGSCSEAPRSEGLEPRRAQASRARAHRRGVPSPVEARQLAAAESDEDARVAPGAGPGEDVASRACGGRTCLMSAVSTRRKVREGVVVSDRMDKTVVVAVERLVRHQRYQKYRRRRARYKAQEETKRCRMGDTRGILERAQRSAET